MAFPTLTSGRALHSIFSDEQEMEVFLERLHTRHVNWAGHKKGEVAWLNIVKG